MPPSLSPWAFFGSLDNILITLPPKATPKPAPPPLTYGTILHLFPTGRTAWAEAHNTAITSSQATVKKLKTRISYLADLKRTYTPELDSRKILIARPQGVPEKLFLNWKEWSFYFAHLEELVGAAEKHVAWLELLEGEYGRAELLWEEFWMLDEEIERDEASTVFEGGSENGCGEEGVGDEEKVGVGKAEKGKGEKGKVEEGKFEKGNVAEGKVDEEMINEEMINEEMINEEKVNKGTASEIEGREVAGNGDTAPRDKADDDEGDDEGDEYHDRLEERLRDLLAKLNVHNTRKDFLHHKILEGNNTERMRMFFGEGEPEWIEWPPTDSIGGAKG